MKNLLKIMTFAMLGLLVSNNQIALADQGSTLNKSLLMEIDNFFESLSEGNKNIVTVDCHGGSVLQKGKAIAVFENPDYTGAIGSAENCKVFFTGSTNIGRSQQTSNVVVLNKPKISREEQSILNQINAFFMKLQKQGKVTLVTQGGVQKPNEEPIARYNNPNKSGKAGLTGGGLAEVEVYATPFHTSGLIGTEGKPVKLRKSNSNNYMSKFFTNTTPYRSMSQPSASANS